MSWLNESIFCLEKCLIIHELDDTAEGGVIGKLHGDLLAVLILHLLDDGDF